MLVIAFITGRRRAAIVPDQNTATLGESWVSDAMVDEVKENPKLSAVGPPAPIAFDEEGNLF